MNIQNEWDACRREGKPFNSGNEIELFNIGLHEDDKEEPKEYSKIKPELFYTLHSYNSSSIPISSSSSATTSSSSSDEGSEMADPFHIALPIK